MNRRFRALVLSALPLVMLTGRAGASPATPRPVRPTPVTAANVAVRTVSDAEELYSPHARRLVRTYLRLRLLELREADLDRARAVIEGKLRVDDLLAPPTRPPVVP